MKRFFHKKNRVSRSNSIAAVAASGVVAVGGLALLAAFATGAFIELEPGNIAPMGKASVVNDGTASGGSFLQFGLASGQAPSPTPTPTPPPNGGSPGGGTKVVPANAQLLYSEDFVSFDEWSCHTRTTDCTPWAVETVNDGPGHESAGRFELRAGDKWPEYTPNQRTEITGVDALDTKSGDERWYEFSLKIPEGFKKAGGDNRWLIIMQWHPGGGSPELALEVSEDGSTLQFEGGQTGKTAEISGVKPGQWVDYTLHMGFSDGDGYIEAWENGVKKLNRTPWGTITSSDGNYLKMGIYRNDADVTHIIHYDNFKVYAP